MPRKATLVHSPPNGADLRRQQRDIIARSSSTILQKPRATPATLERMPPSTSARGYEFWVFTLKPNDNTVMQHGCPSALNTASSNYRLQSAMNYMKFCKRTVALSVLTAMAAAFAQSQSASPAAPQPAPQKAASQPTQALTTAELAKVKNILAPYKSTALTTDDAKLIKRTLRDAGLRRSPALDAALNSAGFSGAKLDQLDPPPPRSPEGAPPPPKK